MKKLKYNKILNVLLKAVPLVFIFISINNICLNEEKLFVSILSSFFKVLLIIYAVNFLSFLLLIIIFYFADKTIFYFSFYPLSYDGSFRFQPIQMFFHQELYETLIPYNITNLLEDINDIELINIELKKNVFLWLLSSILSSLFIWLYIKHFYRLDLIFELFVFLITNILAQFMYYNINHYGYLFSLYNKNSEVYSLLKTPFKFISFQKYLQVLQNLDSSIIEHDKVKNELVHKYLYKCIDTKLAPIKLAELESHLNFELNNLELLNTIKLIGLVGKTCNKKEYVKYSIKKMRIVKSFYINNDLSVFINTPIDRIQEYIDFLNNKRHINNPNNHIILGVNSLYDCEQEVEVKIVKILSEI